MKKEPTFLQLVLDIVSEEVFNKLNEEEKKVIYKLLEENYQKRIDISYRQGYTAGKFEGTNEAIKLLNTK
jgi:hypothetical protein